MPVFTLLLDVLIIHTFYGKIKKNPFNIMWEYEPYQKAFYVLGVAKFGCEKKRKRILRRKVNFIPVLIHPAWPRSTPFERALY